MLKGPLKAKGVEVKIIVSNISVLEDAVNHWLSNAPEDLIVYDILYQHIASTADSPGKASVIIVFGKK